MSNPKFEITPKVFYMSGKFIFFLAGIIGFIRILDTWEYLRAYDVASSFAFAVFYLLMSGFFSYLQKKEDMMIVNDPDIALMNKALDELNLEEDKDAKKKTRRVGR